MFSLPSKRKLHSDVSIEVILLDATEVEIERLQKTKAILLRKNAY